MLARVHPTTHPPNTHTHFLCFEGEEAVYFPVPNLPSLQTFTGNSSSSCSFSVLHSFDHSVVELYLWQLFGIVSKIRCRQAVTCKDELLEKTSFQCAVVPRRPTRNHNKNDRSSFVLSPLLPRGSNGVLVQRDGVARKLVYLRMTSVKTMDTDTPHCFTLRLYSHNITAIYCLSGH